MSSNPGQNCHFFSTLQHPWHPHFWDSNMPLYMHNFYGQAESGGSLLKIDLCTMLCSKKTFNFESFEFPSWEFKNIFWGVYPHQTRAPCTICIPPNRKGHIDPSFPQGAASSRPVASRPDPTSEFYHENSSRSLYNVILCRPPEGLDSTRTAGTF